MTNLSGWTVTFEVAGKPGDVEDDALDRLLDLFTPDGGAVTGAQDGSRYGATFSVDATDAIDRATKALNVGLSLFEARAAVAGLPTLELVRAEVVTYAEHDAELARPAFPELVGVSEIADILGVSRQRAHQLTKREDFPAPVAELKSGPIWARPSLELFIDRWRGDKPDVTEELADIDAELERLRRLRNLIAHGSATAQTAEEAYTSTSVLARVFAGTLGVELNDVPINIHVGGAIEPTNH